MKNKTEIGTDIQKAAALLSGGEIVAIPTETVYGLAANAYNLSAVKSVFEVKMRPYYNPLIVHVASIEQFVRQAANVPALAIKLLEQFSPGPLTVIVPKAASLPDMITNGMPDVAMRIPGHEMTLKLLEQLPYPLVAPSANRFMRLSPTSAAHVAAQLNGDIPYILDGGICTAGVESTVVRISGNMVEVHRVGAISIEQLKTVHPHVIVAGGQPSASPGRLKQHYCPLTQLVLAKDVELTIKLLKGIKIGVLAFGDMSLLPGEDVLVMNLSPEGNLEEAAHNLYRCLYELDNAGLDFIIAALLPEKDLGRTINDRLRRASAIGNIDGNTDGNIL